VRSAPCTWRREARVSWLNLKTNVDGLSVVWAQNHRDDFSSVWISKSMATFCEWFGLKTTRTVFSGLASKTAATVSSDLASKLVVGFLVKPQNQGGRGFLGLDLKTNSYDLVIWASKSPRRFRGLSLKTKWASVCRLRHKTDGGRSARDTHRDLAACFAWKQVWLGFTSLT
jgi:hypothetical protein